MISRKVFGDDISWKVKNKLHARQLFAQGTDINEELPGFYKNLEDHYFGITSNAKPKDWLLRSLVNFIKKSD